MLDAQLDKVEAFYIAREDEMIRRGRLLQLQLNELNDHGLVRHFYISDKAGLISAWYKEGTHYAALDIKHKICH